MTNHFEIKTDMKRGVSRVFCITASNGQMMVIREACSFRTPAKVHKVASVEEAREWAAQFVKGA
jgi:hypothetical protein